MTKKEQLGRSYTFQNMAKACRVQKTYLSRVFNGDAHLNDDQLYLACDFLGLTDEEQHYVNLLHQYERSCVVRKKSQLKAEINLVRSKRNESGSHLKMTVLTAAAPDYADYYLDPQMQLVHMYLTIPRFQTDLAKIRQSLNIKEFELAAILTKLQRLSLIAFRDGRYEVVQEGVHLPPDSPIYKAARAMLRLKSIDKIERLAPADTYNFTVVFSATEEVRGRIQSRFLEFLKSIADDVKNAPAEDVFQLSFDLFGWSK